MTQRLRTLLPVGCLLFLPACPPSENSDETGTGTTAASDTGTTSGTGSEPGPTTGLDTTGLDTTGPGVTGGPDDTTSAPTTVDTTTITTGPDDTTGTSTTTTTDSDTTTAPDTDTTGDPPAECLLPAEPPKPYFTTAVTATVDETCYVSKSLFMGDDVALEFTCPIAGKVAFTLHAGPVPEPYPTEGETFEVFYQRENSEPLTDPRMGLLLLRNGDKLRYGAATGFVFGKQDFARLAAGVLPLTLAIESGPCPHLPTFEDEPWAGDDWVCNYEALALIRLAHEDEQLLQGEGGQGKLMAVGDVYTLDVRLARRGEQCIDFTLDRIALAISGQNFN